MNMKSKKLIQNVLVMLAVVMMNTVMELSSCDNAVGDSEHANITIRLGESRAGRSISDAEKSSATFNVYFNDSLVASNVNGTYTGTAAVGAMLKIRVDALVNGKRIARGEDTITVMAGTNNVAIKLNENRERTGDLKGTPQVGSIIMKDGSLRTSANIGNDTANAIAVVYKVSGGKAWAVGKVLSSSSMRWSTSSADGYNTNITALQESNYSDGSTGLEKLIAAASDAETDLENKYPAWDYACNYGIKQNLTSFQTGWYLPSKQELREIYDNKDAIEAALAQTGVSKTSFVRAGYWSSSQDASADKETYMLDFGSRSGAWKTNCKDDTINYVCAVRQFTYSATVPTRVEGLQSRTSCA